MILGNRTLKQSPRTLPRKKRLSAIARALPEADVSGGQHLTFRVGRRTFGYYLDNHHRDGRIALACKAAAGEQGRLVARHPRRFFVPPYLGHHGWIGLRLDQHKIDWAEVTFLLLSAYRLTAARRLVSRLPE